MQVFIIHFTSPLFLIVNHLKTIPSPVRRERIEGGRFCDPYEFGLLSIRQPSSIGWSGGIRKEAV